MQNIASFAVQSCDVSVEDWELVYWKGQGTALNFQFQSTSKALLKCTNSSIRPAGLLFLFLRTSAVPINVSAMVYSFTSSVIGD